MTGAMRRERRSCDVVQSGQPSVQTRAARRAATTLFGREYEVAQLVATTASTRALTVVGPGGVGKSRLALRLAERPLRQFPDGVHVLDASTAGEPCELVHMTAELLEARGVIPRGDD